MKIGAKRHLKMFAWLIAILQSIALYKGQDFHPAEFGSAIMMLFGINGAYEHYGTYLKQRTAKNITEG